MGTRSKGGYKDPVTFELARLERRERPKKRPPVFLVINKFRIRTRKYRRIKN